MIKIKLIIMQEIQNKITRIIFETKSIERVPWWNKTGKITPAVIENNCEEAQKNWFLWW
jgi:hypothetical protein